MTDRLIPPAHYTILAGTGAAGEDGGPALQATFSGLMGVAVTADENTMYVLESTNNGSIRRIDNLQDPPNTTVTGILGTNLVGAAGALWLSTGQLRCGKTTGNLYVSMVHRDRSHSYYGDADYFPGRIGEFTPGGGFVGWRTNGPEQYPGNGGPGAFDVTRDEATIFYGWVQSVQPYWNPDISKFGSTDNPYLVGYDWFGGPPTVGIGPNETDVYIIEHNYFYTADYIWNAQQGQYTSWGGFNGFALQSWPKALPSADVVASPNGGDFYCRNTSTGQVFGTGGGWPGGGSSGYPSAGNSRLYFPVSANRIIAATLTGWNVGSNEFYSASDYTF